MLQVDSGCGLWVSSGLRRCRCTWEKLLIDLLKVLLGCGWMRLDRGRLWRPVRWADLPVGLHILEGLHQAQGLLHAPAHWEVVDAQVLDDPIGVNYEEASQSEPGASNSTP